ncbi:hypothetical protein BDW68DRAFT_180649 [Aspergillus falconensis]
MLAYILIFTTLVCALGAIDIDIDIGLDEQLRDQALHEIHVGLTGTQLFVPNQINANIGDKIVFIFHGGNHTLTQSSLETPCVPAAEFDSGFNNFNPHQQDDISLTLTVTTLESQWFFCKQDKPSSHCHAGMVFAINPGDNMASFLRRAKTETPRAVSSGLPTASPTFGTHYTRSLTAVAHELQTQASTLGLSIVPVDPNSVLPTSMLNGVSAGATPGHSVSSSSLISAVTPTTPSLSHGVTISTASTGANSVSSTTTASTSTGHTSGSTLTSSDTGQGSNTGIVVTSLPTNQGTGVAATTRQSVPWRQKRLERGPHSDPRRKAKAERERFRRGKLGAFKRLNDLYLDGIETGRERHIYAVVASRAWDGTMRYTTYDTHPHKDWLPPREQIAKNNPEEKWTPRDLELKESRTTQQKGPRMSVTISRPPLLDIPPTPKLV